MIFKRIETNPKILGGKPVIKGTRIPVYLIVELVAQGYTHQKIIAAYPQVKKEDIKECLEYAAYLAKYEEKELLEAV
jgi:uncharacterized protein (DUF433 family)